MNNYPRACPKLFLIAVLLLLPVPLQAVECKDISIIFKSERYHPLLPWRDSDEMEADCRLNQPDPSLGKQLTDRERELLGNVWSDTPIFMSGREADRVRELADSIQRKLDQYRASMDFDALLRSRKEEVARILGDHGLRLNGSEDDWPNIRIEVQPEHQFKFNVQTPDLSAPLPSDAYEWQYYLGTRCTGEQRGSRHYLLLWAVFNQHILRTMEGLSLEDPGPISPVFYRELWALRTLYYTHCDSPEVHNSEHTCTAEESREGYQHAVEEFKQAITPLVPALCRFMGYKRLFVLRDSVRSTEAELKRLYKHLADAE